jgi:hypothetical protein
VTHYDDDSGFDSFHDDLWSSAHGPALQRYGLDVDVYEELSDEEWEWDGDTWREPYEDDIYEDDFEQLYEDDQA